MPRFRFCAGIMVLVSILFAGCAPVPPADVVLPAQATAPIQDLQVVTRTPILLPTATGEQPVFQGPLSVIIYTPLDGDTVSASPVEVRGEAEPGTIVTFNDLVVLVEEGRAFTVTLALEPGTNLIEITASDAAGKQGFGYLSILLEE